MIRWPWTTSGAGSANRATRWVVLDVETTGLDTNTDHVLSVAAIGVHRTHGHSRLEIHLSDHFEAQLRPPQLSGDANVLVHGLGRGSQQAADAPENALAALAHFVANAPILGFHVGFDKAMLERAWRLAKLPAPDTRWLDMAPLCELAWPEHDARNLDEWLHATGLSPLARHAAAADTLVTAELLACAWPRLYAQFGGRWSDLEQAVGQRRWLR
jgi:DNA polymerase-3 subunit epsilon